MKKKPKVRVEPVAVKAPRSKPLCPMHSMHMEYDQIRGVWACVVDGCHQIAFPANQTDKGKPVVGTGTIELMRIKDPGGSKEGRYLLRSVESNVILDITDYVDNVLVGTDTGQVHSVTLRVEHFLDTRSWEM
jgi:hypothetical protein